MEKPLFELGDEVIVNLINRTFIVQHVLDYHNDGRYTYLEISEEEFLKDLEKQKNGTQPSLTLGVPETMLRKLTKLEKALK